jgi:hypothetical protein
MTAAENDRCRLMMLEVYAERFQNGTMSLADYLAATTPILIEEPDEH